MNGYELVRLQPQQVKKSGDTMTGNLNMSANILPTTNNARDLGSANLAWRKVYGTSTSADKLTTARTISLTGDVTGQVNFDGSGNAAIATTHHNVTRTNTVVAERPNLGQSFTAVSGVTTNAKGHVTGVETKTITLPAAQNVDEKVKNELNQTTRAYVTGTTSATTNTGTQIFDTGVYLDTTAGRLSANTLNLTANGSAITHMGTNIIRNQNNETYLSAKNSNVVIRPQGDTAAGGQTIFATNGTITTSGNIIPNVNNTNSLGINNTRWSDVWTTNINGFHVGGEAGNRWGIIPVVSHGDSSMNIGWVLSFHRTDGNTTSHDGRIYFDGQNTFSFTHGLFPNSQDRLDIGDNSRRWRSAYFVGNVNAAAHVNNSERKFKTNIKEFDCSEAYEGIKNLPIYTYNYKKSSDEGQEIILDEEGNIVTPSTLEESHEFNPHINMGTMVDEAPKEIVSEDGTGIDIYAFVSYTASALKSAIKKIEALEKEVEELKTQI